MAAPTKTLKKSTVANGFIGCTPSGSSLGSHFHAVLSKYSRACGEKDFAWRYGERPLTGMLSAAAWQAGGVSLEEYWAHKKKPRKSYGRIDLYFRLRKKEYLCEAKHDYVDLAKCEGDWMMPLLEQCQHDARKNIHGDKECRAAIAFWTIRSTKKEIQDGDGLERVEKLVSTTKANKSALLTLWHFPDWALAKNRDDGEKDIRYPGVIMQMVEVE